MKKILALTLALLLVIFAFAACGKKKAPEGDETIVATGEKGDKGDKGDKGNKGDAFVYEDFTKDQLEKIE